MALAEDLSDSIVNYSFTRSVFLIINKIRNENR